MPAELDPLGRRRFLTAAVLGTTATVAGATVLGSIGPEAVADPATPIDPDAPDPNFAEGRITGIDGTLLLVTGSDGVFHRIQVTNATSVWKLRPTVFGDAKLGDGLYARGVRLADGVLAADAVWLNIVNMTVHITAMARDRMYLDHHGHRVVGHVVSGTTAAVYNSTPAVADLSLLRVGQHARVIGAWRPDTNEVDVATVYASAA
ncbi:hypothetical protein EV193_11675 [Herbihabitans rhizosphaerae]|uniref:Cell wall protein n=1 Tax=Herbihabitans rhizosphaerae TaxID=1872711 RepID=A0A4Q7KCI8_9PSEU|nr:cell wall protein [Herbihabitans rhizosphaerae]RZS30554.1 hypothetical protein EV193_11675 [Herbihabitans rhizosphaerae]